MKQNDLKRSSQQDTFQSETTNEGSNIKLQRRMGEKPQRNHKDSTFCLLFSEPQRAIESQDPAFVRKFSGRAQRKFARAGCQSH